MPSETIVIVGAGIGGLVAALSLQRAGYRPTLVERAPALAEVGAGLSLTPNAVKGLEDLGLTDFLRDNANEPLEQNTYNGLTGELLLSFDRRTCRDDYGAAYYQMHRADFHEELVRRVRATDPDAIRLNSPCKALDLEGHHPRIELEDGSTLDADVVVGADGVRSLIRGAAFGADEVTFTGQMAWRAVLDAKDLPGFYQKQASHNWVGPGRTFVSYPIKRGQKVNVVAFAQTNDWVEESWSVPAQPGEIREQFKDWCGPVQTLLDHIREEDCFRWGLFARAPLDRLVHGGVALIGDAAHPMLPFLGQGASSAIEDGVVLGRCLAQTGDLKSRLERYNAARLDRVSLLQRESNLGPERLQGLDPDALKTMPLRNEDGLGIFRYNPVTEAL